MSDAPPRSLQSDLQQIGRRASETARDTGNLVRAAVSAEPYVAAAAALGVGFLAGGGLNRHTRAFLLGTGARMVGAWLVQEVAPGSGARAGAHGPEDGGDHD